MKPTTVPVAISPEELADIFWVAANERLSSLDWEDTEEDKTAYSCSAIEEAMARAGYSGVGQAQDLLSPATHRFLMVRDLLTDERGARMDIVAMKSEATERIQGQRYLWLMMCHEAAKDGFFHQDRDGNPRKVVLARYV